MPRDNQCFQYLFALAVEINLLILVKGKKGSVSFSITSEILLTLGTQEASVCSSLCWEEETDFLGLWTLNYSVSQALAAVTEHLICHHAIFIEPYCKIFLKIFVFYCSFLPKCGKYWLYVDIQQLWAGCRNSWWRLCTCAMLVVRLDHTMILLFWNGRSYQYLSIKSSLEVEFAKFISQLRSQRFSMHICPFIEQFVWSTMKKSYLTYVVNS